MTKKLITHITRENVLKGVNSPINKVTPEFIGQQYIDSQGNIYISYALDKDSWASTQARLDNNLKTNSKEVVGAINELNEQCKENMSQLEHKTTEFNTVADMKNYNCKKNDKVKTFGYYSVNDGGGAKYVIVENGIDDGGSCIRLNNGLYAKLVHNGVIYARQFGVKLDDENDDTNALNNFFKLCGEAKLIIDNGIAVVSDTVFVKGKWREDSATKYNNSLRKIEFINSSIRYVGIENKCCIMFYNHFATTVDGLAISRVSNNCYVDMTMVWHSEFRNFDIPNLCMNKDFSIINDKVETNSCHTNKFDRGFIYNGNLYMDSTTTYINSIHFLEVNFFSNKSDYCCILKGGWFQNTTFTRCDLSYANKSIFKIYDTADKNGSISLTNCYLDSAIPYTEDYDYKNFRIDNINNFEASRSGSSRSMVFTKDYLKNYNIGGYISSGANLPMMCMNVAINGNLEVTDTHHSSGWITNSQDVSYEFIKSSANTSGNALRCTFTNNTKPIIYFKSVPLPTTSVYTCALRVKKVSGSGVLQLALNGIYLGYDFGSIADGEDIIMVNNTRKEKEFEIGSTLNFSLSAYDNSNINNLVLDILEVILLPGDIVLLNTPLHPKAKIAPIILPNNTHLGVTYPTNTNLDTIMDNQKDGLYTVYGFNQSGTVPTTGLSVLGMKSSYDSGSFQLGFGAWSSSMYFRSTNNGAYAPWERILTDKFALSCNSNGRPTDAPIGICYFDKTLGKPIWYKGSSIWVDANGTTV